MDRFYRGVRAVARFWLWFLFKAVDARHPERVPAGGPILLCVNHPNNFIDSLVVGSVVAPQGPLPGHRVDVPQHADGALPPGLRRHPRLPAAGRSRQDGQEPRHLRRLLHDLRAGPAGGDLPRGHDARGGARAADQDRRRPHRARVRGQPSRRATDDPGGALVRGAQGVSQPRAGGVRRGDPARRLPARLPRGSGEGGRRAHARSAVGDGGFRSSTSSASTTSGWCARWRSCTATT